MNSLQLLKRCFVLVIFLSTMLSCNVLQESIFKIKDFSKTEEGEVVGFLLKKRAERVLAENGIQWTPESGKYTGVLDNASFRKAFGHKTADFFTSNGTSSLETENFFVNISWSSLNTDSTLLRIDQKMYPLLSE